MAAHHVANVLLGQFVVRQIDVLKAVLLEVV